MLTQKVIENNEVKIKEHFYVIDVKIMINIQKNVVKVYLWIYL